MAATARRFDVFCRVVDNFGDAGVAWRLCRQLEAEHAADVTLWIDDPASLARIAPDGDERIRVVALGNETAPPAALPQVVIETFGCGLPAVYLDAMEQAAPPPLWINLEYLSAETWIEGTHGLPSPHPQRGLTRWFYFPGFTGASGGLLRERALFDVRDRVQADPASRTRTWTSIGLEPPPRDTLTVSLFCYPNAATPALFEAWAEGDLPLACIVPEGVATAALDRFFGGNVPHAGQARAVGDLIVAVAPFVGQDAFDRRLWTCDLNVVRGEDSFVRAQWAARPMVWHIYPQSERAHTVKLGAFLERYAAGLDAASERALRDFTFAFNEGDGDASVAAWEPLRASLPSLAAHAKRWAGGLGSKGDLATRLVAFAQSKL
jgi:uncharacterized repeat protein (TIGR03837 family)